jgi:hypothetical protein
MMSKPDIVKPPPRPAKNDTDHTTKNKAHNNKTQIPNRTKPKTNIPPTKPIAAGTTPAKSNKPNANKSLTNQATTPTSTKPAIIPASPHKSTQIDELPFTTVVHKKNRPNKKVLPTTQTRRTTVPTPNFDTRHSHHTSTTASDSQQDDSTAESTPVSETLFNILVQVLHPYDNDVPGPMTTVRLRTILTTTFAHHLERIPFLLFSIKQITFVKSEKRAKPHQNQYAHYFRLILAPTATMKEPCDPDYFYEQCLAFALQHWHLRSNHQFSISPDSAFADQLISPEVKRPPSNDPWTKHINLLLPAVNNFQDQAKGCLLGIPPDSFGASRRGCLDILEYIYYHLQPHFPTNKLGVALNADYHTFLEYVGLRPAFLQTFGQKNNQRAPVFFICCYSGDAWTLILKAAQLAGTFNIHGCACIIHPFPKPEERPKFIQGANLLSQRLKEMVHINTDRLQIVYMTDEEELLTQTPHIVAVIPRFVDHSPQAVCHTLIFLPSPETVCYTNDTLHDALIPQRLLAPLPPPTYLSTATTHTPAPPADTAPDLLATIFGQWDAPPPNTPPSPPTPSRKRTCNSPTQAKQSPDDDSTLDEDDEDIDDDGDINDDNNDQDDDEDYDEDYDDEDYRPSDDLSSEHSDDMQDTDFIPKSELQDEDDPELMLSQTASSEYKQIEFFVESNHPERMEEFLILLKHFKSTQEDPTALRNHISSWTNDKNE